MNKLKDKVIVVTGGSGLLGPSILKDLAGQGAIAVNADIEVENSAEKQTVLMDITKPESVQNAIKWVVDTYGYIYGLVNNAYPRTSDWGAKFEDVDPESLNTNMNWQMGGYFTCSQEALKYFKEQKEGVIVNVASIYGVAAPDFSIYEGTEMTMPVGYAIIKAGLINFTKYLAAYYGESNIRVNAVSPGGIFNSQPETFVEKYESKVPLGRMGKPEDIAPTISFLLSDDARYITGQNIIVDGGWTAL